MMLRMTMQPFSRQKQILFDICTFASVIAAVIITYVCLRNGIYEIFPYFYLIPVVLIAFSRPKLGIYGTVLIGWLYFMLVWLWEPPDVTTFYAGNNPFLYLCLHRCPDLGVFPGISQGRTEETQFISSFPGRNFQF